MPLTPEPEPSPAPPSVLRCRLCGQVHRRVLLGRGHRAMCIRCGTLLARRSWWGRDAALAFAVTGVICAIPAFALPFITVSKLGRAHTGYLLTGATSLWEAGMRLLAVWVAICGTIAPALLLLALTGAVGRALRFGPSTATRAWSAIAHAVEHWAMPEVHVLAVLVALIKLGDLVEVRIGLGFWCYVAMSIALLLAWRSFGLESTEPARTARVHGEAHA